MKLFFLLAETVTIKEKNPPIAGMKDSFKNKFALDRKKTFSGRSLSKRYKRWFVLARKSVSTTRNEAFAENALPPYVKIASSGKKIKQNGFH